MKEYTIEAFGAHLVLAQPRGRRRIARRLAVPLSKRRRAQKPPPRSQQGRRRSSYLTGAVRGLGPAASRFPNPPTTRADLVPNGHAARQAIEKRDNLAARLSTVR